MVEVTKEGCFDVYELEVYSRLGYTSEYFHFKVDETLEERVKDLVLSNAINTNTIYRQCGIKDEEIEDKVKSLRIDDEGFMQLKVEELLLYYSGRFRRLL